MPTNGRQEPRLGPDGRLLFVTRAARMFSYGFLSVVLVLYLAGLGFSEGRIGLLLTLTLVGDTLISLWITLHADRLGRKKMLLVGAALMVMAGIPFALSGDFTVLVLAATFGVISPSGNEVGPFLAIEQAALSQVLPESRRTGVFAWYNLTGSFATALGALAGGWSAQALQAAGHSPVASYRVLVFAYAAVGLVLAVLFTRMSPAVEAPPAATHASRWGLHASKGVVLRLSALFSLDAFAGGFVIQSIVAYWFHVKFGVAPGALGSIFFAANILAGLSSPVRREAGGEDRAHPHHGLHPHPLERAADPGAAHAEPAPGRGHAAAAVQHLPDGRAHAPGLHHGRGGARRALRRRRRDRHRPHHRRRHLAGAGGAPAGRARPGRGALPHRRRAEDPLRSAAVPELPLVGSRQVGGATELDRGCPRDAERLEAASLEAP